MQTYHFYALSTGLIDPGRSFSGAAEHLAENTPDGFGAIAGVSDALSQRVHLQTGELQDYQPPAPADDAMRTWAWDATLRRWLPTLTVQGRKPAMLAQLQAQMLEVESAAQARPTRELLLSMLAGTPPDAATVQRLQATEAALASLRARHAAVLAAATHQQLDEVTQS